MIELAPDSNGQADRDADRHVAPGALHAGFHDPGAGAGHGHPPALGEPLGEPGG